LFICEPCEKASDEWNERQKQARIETNIRRSQLPLAYQTGQRGFNDVRHEEALRLARGVIAGEVRGMYLFGAAGEDKTTVACATLAQIIRNGATGLYENSLDLMADIQATFTPGSALSRQDVVGPPVQAHALLLDDFGKEKGSEFSASVIYQILDGRYNFLTVESKRVLIIVSNHAPAAACARFGDPTMVQPILRRISELTVPMEMTH
jgi:DNA replication protein DnaC